MTTTSTPASEGTQRGAPAEAPMESKRRGEQVTLGIFIAVPFLALILAIPFAWGWGLTWVDLGLALVFYVVSGLGITVGYHRYFTHGSFKAKRALRVALAIAGSLAIEGPVIRWVADHRRHHAFSDREGDPHSPWRYGETVPALMKGLWWAHVGWLFDIEQTPRTKYAPDLIADPDITTVDKAFPALVLTSLLGPAVLGGLLTWSLWGAVTAFFWASLVRVALLHHVTWSINSICHAMGERPFASRDRSGNVWWLAILSFGESWHNLHHADPTCARHGVDPGQVDISARVIWAFERLGWAWDVRWPKEKRIEARRMTA
ncbi:Fatty acid desaturase [Nostocoides japonicum T1-X7]|uniref:Fatty acid desaturase n=1 Tax=Nostocoides japonicum T1-X7 TaxID=1194083 RepID=A0A077M1H5_9MICO|nr:acyl-CoA desaturase [Tetrasphaera japonica]CCH78070.1 Fatty acid desaturase [Tetrasphaera japonica T1-X7]